jgi:hypothetical protein
MWLKWKKKCAIGNKVGFSEVDVCCVGDLSSHNNELSNEDLIEVEKEEVGVEGMAETEVVCTLTS